MTTTACLDARFAMFDWDEAFERLMVDQYDPCPYIRLPSASGEQVCIPKEDSPSMSSMSMCQSVVDVLMSTDYCPLQMVYGMVPGIKVATVQWIMSTLEQMKVIVKYGHGNNRCYKLLPLPDKFEGLSGRIIQVLRSRSTWCEAGDLVTFVCGEEHEHMKFCSKRTMVSHHCVCLATLGYIVHNAGNARRMFFATQQ